MDVIVEAHHVNREVLAGIVGVGRALVAIERGGFGPDLVDKFACCHDPISVLWFVLPIIVYNIRRIYYPSVICITFAGIFLGCIMYTTGILLI